jgi:hypothetical protein
MSKMTIATDQHGNVLGAIQHSANGKANGDIQVGVNFAPGAQMHEVDVTPEIDMSKATDAAKYHEALRHHIMTR